MVGCGVTNKNMFEGELPVANIKIYLFKQKFESWIYKLTKIWILNSRPIKIWPRIKGIYASYSVWRET